MNKIINSPSSLAVFHSLFHKCEGHLKPLYRIENSQNKRRQFQMYIARKLGMNLEIHSQLSFKIETPYLWLCGTCTVTLWLDEYPALSVLVMVIV